MQAVVAEAALPDMMAAERVADELIDEAAGLVVVVVEDRMGDSGVSVVGLDEAAGWDRGRRAVGDDGCEAVGDVRVLVPVAVAVDEVVVVVAVVGGLSVDEFPFEGVHLVQVEAGVELVCQYLVGFDPVLHFEVVHGVDFAVEVVSVPVAASDAAAVVVAFVSVPVVAPDTPVAAFASTDA